MSLLGIRCFCVVYCGMPWCAGLVVDFDLVLGWFGYCCFAVVDSLFLC